MRAEGDPSDVGWLSIGLRDDVFLIVITRRLLGAALNICLTIVLLFPILPSGDNDVSHDLRSRYSGFTIRTSYRDQRYFQTHLTLARVEVSTNGLRPSGVILQRWRRHLSLALTIRCNAHYVGFRRFLTTLRHPRGFETARFPWPVVNRPT